MEAERSFSCVKRIRTWQRSTMTTERLSNLSPIAIHTTLSASLEDRYSMASTLDGLAMGWGICPGKANIWCKYYLLRQYSSSLSAAESSTLMTTDDGTMSSSSTSNNYGVVLLQV
ncbi:hypothetical protein GQR58_015244 [Nymphon striatum]|nr:hypothetical protein GQR58_015244 [Nymphon striatum]